MKIDGKRIFLRDWRLEDLNQLGFWWQPHQQWYETDGLIIRAQRRKVSLKRFILTGSLYRTMNSGIPDKTWRFVRNRITN